jgi:ABC-type dipeptide/oligopeptide/nickel transport system ATPase subunit
MMVIDITIQAEIIKLAKEHQAQFDDQKIVIAAHNTEVVRTGVCVSEIIPSSSAS